MAVGWTDAEVFKLIELWKEEGIQEQLEGATRNKHVYVKLASDMTKAGFSKNGEQCRNKVKKLRQEYKKIKDNNGLTGRGRRKWRFYDAMDEILGNRPATRPPVVIDTTEDTTDPARDSFNLSDGEQENSYGEESSERNAGSSSAALEDLDNNSSAPEPATDSKLKRSNKRKRGKVEAFEEVVSKVMKTVTDGLRETDKMFLELEEKRMEMEAQQKREERQFQLQLAQMLVGQPSGPPYHYPGYPPQFYGAPPVAQSQHHPDTYETNNL